MPSNAHHARPAPCLLVIFGASGDLTRRKLIPSLFHLYQTRQLPEHFAVLGVSRRPMSDDAFRDHLHLAAREFAPGFDAAAWTDFARLIHYHAMDSTAADDFQGLKRRLEQKRAQHRIGQNLILYLALAPQLYEPTIVQIGAAGLVTEGKAWCSLDRDNRPWQRIVVEKPFGQDPGSAAHLNRVLGRVFEEESIYRIDHYLGKETVQNLLVFRFANTIFEPLWNRGQIDHVQVTAAETVGVEGRGAYYDSPAGGCLRDMIQSHLLQVMTLVAMEPPVSMSAEDIRAEKLKVLRAVRPPRPQDVPRIAVRGQYGPGQMAGQAVAGYRQEPGVAPESQTDTYAAMQVGIDTWRWGGVPFYLRSGKAMARKATEVVVTFKPTPQCLFRDRLAGCGSLKPNQIVINLQPDEGIRLRFEGKVPGLAGPLAAGTAAGTGAPGMNIKSVVMDFDYIKQFQAQPPEAYAQLLLDCMRGDQTLYKHRDEIEDAWGIVQPVLDQWAEHPQEDLPNYAAGTWGPSAADILLARDHRHWHNG